ncbi:MAG: autotransporter domain-containing protein [Lysobacteraceae bacterium]
MIGLLCGQSSIAQTDPEVSLTPLQETTGVMTAQPGADTTLSVIKRQNGQGMPGETVSWKVVGPGSATLTPTSGMTAAQGATSDAGIATTVFHAKASGRYTVTATTQKNPGCATPSCATYISTQFSLDVASAAASDSDGNTGSTSQKELIGAAVALGTGIAIALNNNDHNTKVILRSLSAVSGDGQSAAANTALALPLAVHASNDGSSAGSIGIQWSASGGAVLSAPLSFTDASGVAGIRVVSVGPGPGPVIITATRSDDPSASVSFTVNVILPSLDIVSGNGQSAFTSTEVENPLVVEARIGSTPQSGVPIVWTVTGGDATVTSVSNGGHTDSSGQSSAVITFGSNPGAVEVTATRNDGSGLSQTFYLNSVLTRTLSIVSGDMQSGPPNVALPNPLVVHAVTNDADASGVTINWTASGGATLSAASSVTNGSGQASVTVTNLGSTLGPITVTATRADDPSATVLFTETIYPPDLTITGGDAQSGLIGSQATNSLQVHLVDGGGNPFVGQTITWAVVSGSATLSSYSTVTDSNGDSNITFAYGNSPGPVVISASAFSGTQTIDFTVTAATADSLSKITGDAQSGAPGTSLPIPLKIRIQPPSGVTVLSGVPIDFSVVSGSASVTVGSAMTDSAGEASTTVDLGLTPGPVSVLAQVSGGGPSTTFTETVTGTLVPGVLTVASGDKQVIAPNTASQPLVVVLNGSGSPLSGQTITWTTTAGNLSASSSVTDANGHASVTLTPTASGPIVVTANFAGYAQYVAGQITFSENTTLGSITTLTTNDQQIGLALDSACSSLATLSNRTPQQQDLLNQCLALNASSGVSTSSTAAAIHELTPDVTETQTQTAQTATTAQFSNLAGRMNALRSGAHGASFAGLAFTNTSGSLPIFDAGAVLLGVEDKPKQETDAFSRWGFFASGQIGRQDAGARNQTPAYNLNVHGLTFGADYRKSDNLVLGAALGYTRQATSLSGGQGDLSMTGWSLSGYATWYQKNNWYLDSSLTFGNNNFDSRRVISYSLPLAGGGTTTINQLARASSGGSDLAGSLTFGRDFNNKAWAYGFYGKLQYSHQYFDAFAEQLNTALPGSGLGLRVDKRTETAISSVLGGKLDYTDSTSWGVMIPHAELEWQHEYRTDPNAFRAFFIDDPTGTPILIKGDAIDSDYFRLGFGVSFVFPKGRSGFILYDRILGRTGITQDNLSLGFRMEF